MRESSDARLQRASEDSCCTKARKSVHTHTHQTQTRRISSNMIIICSTAANPAASNIQGLAAAAGCVRNKQRASTRLRDIPAQSHLQPAAIGRRKTDHIACRAKHRSPCLPEKAIIAQGEQGGTGSGDDQAFCLLFIFSAVSCWLPTHTVAAAFFPFWRNGRGETVTAEKLTHPLFCAWDFLGIACVRGFVLSSLHLSFCSPSLYLYDSPAENIAESLNLGDLLLRCVCCLSFFAGGTNLGLRRTV